MKDTDKLKDKFKEVNAVTFTTYGKELVMCFSGFEDEEDLKEFADFVFAKIKMQYNHQDEPPQFH
tara:strand:+ start:397 stop:591 length:195 start_codon:yes stop_codon:yes gene_type:complete